MRGMRVPSVIVRPARSVIALILCCFPGLSQDVEQIRTFTSLRHGYTVQYPGNWHPHFLEDVFYIENFSPSKTVRGVRLPKGGASIQIVSSSQIGRGAHQSPATLEDLVALDTSASKILLRRVLKLDSGQRSLSVIEVESECCQSDVFHQTALYFEVDGRMFVARLFCWPDDKNVEKLQDVLKQVVLSLRVNQP